MAVVEPCFEKIKEEAMIDIRFSQISVPVVIFFWCDVMPGCETMRIILEELAEKYQINVCFYWVDVGEQERICNRFNVTSYPTVVILQEGEEKDRFVCSTSKDGIQHVLNELLKAGNANPKGPKEADIPHYC